MIVLDASAVVAYLTDGAGRHDAVDAAVSAREPTLAPELIHIEVCHSLRRLVRFGVVSEQRSLLALDRLHELRLHTYGHLSLVDRVWGLRDNLTAYDAAYVALAELMDASLMTADRGLASVANRLLGSDRVDLLE